MKKPSDDLIGALVLKAQEENGAESAGALKTLKRLCESHGLDFEEILSGGEKIEYHFLKYKKGQKDLARQVIARYALTKDHMIMREHKWDTQFAFECTAAQHIETIHAYEVLSPLFTKERKKVLKAFHYGFLDKHNLYPQFTIERKAHKDETMEEQRARLQGSMLAEHMEDAVISPRLEGGSV